MATAKKFEPGQAQQTEDKQQALTVAASLGKLEERLRVPLCLCYEVGLSQKEVSEILGCSPQAVSKYVRLGLEKLRRICSAKGTAVSAVALPKLLTEGLSFQTPVFPESLEAALKATQEKIFSAHPPFDDLSAPSPDAQPALGLKTGLLSLTLVLCIAGAGAWYYSGQTTTPSQVPAESAPRSNRSDQASLKPVPSDRPGLYWDFNEGIPKEFDTFKAPPEVNQAFQKAHDGQDKSVDWASAAGLQSSGAVRFGPEGGRLMVPISIPLDLDVTTLECEITHTDKTDSWIDTFIFRDPEHKLNLHANDPAKLPKLPKMDEKTRERLLEVIRKRQKKIMESMIPTPTVRVFKGNRYLMASEHFGGWRHMIRRYERRLKMMRSVQYMGSLPGGTWEWIPTSGVLSWKGQAYVILYGKNVVLDDLRLSPGTVGVLPERVKPAPLSWPMQEDLLKDFHLEGAVKKVEGDTESDWILRFGPSGGRIHLQKNLDWEHVYVECLARPLPNARALGFGLVAVNLEEKKQRTDPSTLNAEFPQSRNWAPWSWYIHNGDVKGVKAGANSRRTLTIPTPKYPGPYRIWLRGENVMIRDLKIRFMDTDKPPEASK